nr:hypothetical protein [Nocardia sp.]
MTTFGHGQAAEQLPHNADHDHRRHGPDEEVGGKSEGAPRFSQTTQIAESDQPDNTDGDHVVDQQRHRRDLGDPRAEVLPGDHIRPAGFGVDLHDLAVGQRHQQQDDQHDPRDRQYEGERQHAEDRK